MSNLLVGTVRPPDWGSKTKHHGARWGFLFGCSFFAYSWKLPAYSRASLLTVDNFSFFTYNWSFLLTIGAFFAYNFIFLGQRSSTVSKKAPTVSQKAFPFFFHSGQVCDSNVVPHLRLCSGPSRERWLCARLLEGKSCDLTILQMRA